MPQPEQSIGQLVQLACTWEVLARKAGNVCPGREFPDLTVADFLASAAAIAPIMNDAPHQPLGVTILRAIEATRRVVNTNTNLGIVLLLAPLASVPLDEPLQPGLTRVLAQTTVEDARNVYAAIRLAKPGGLGQAKEQDVRDEPTLPLREVMGLAKDRDLIAAQYVTDFHLCWELALTMDGFIGVSGTIEHAIVDTHVFLLSRAGDDLIQRKLGTAIAESLRHYAKKVYEQSFETKEGRRGFREFDAWLRADNHRRNPGTTADILAGALFFGLREGFLSPSMPFVWDEHPFAVD